MPTLAVGMLETGDYDMPTASVGMAPLPSTFRNRNYGAPRINPLSVNWPIQ